MNRRQQWALGLVFGMMVAFIAGLNMFDGNRLAQLVVAGIYAVAVVLIMSWGNRTTA